MTDIEIAPAILSDLSYVDHLQRKNAEELSFYPTTVFEREIENLRIILARVNGEPAGYLYHGALGVNCKIHQACIEYDLRGMLYGSRLVGFLIELCEVANVHSLTLRCGSDIAANFFWENMGFYCEAVTKGGVRRMRDINCWKMNLQPQLFIESVEASTKKQDASIWRKRKVGLGNQFLRGKQLAEYRRMLTGE